MKNASIWRKCHLIIYLFLTSKLCIGRWKLGVTAACGVLHFAFLPIATEKMKIAKLAKHSFWQEDLAPFSSFIPTLVSIRVQQRDSPPYKYKSIYEDQLYV